MQPIIKLIAMSLLFSITLTLIPNCAYEVSNRCVSCFMGFKLESNQCQNCVDGFLMYNQNCIEKELYIELTGQPITQGNSNIINSQNNMQNTQTTTSNNQPTTNNSTVTNSNEQVFDVSNTGLMYFLRMFGLGSKIPLNCQTFTAQFKCLACATGYLLTTANTCIKWTATTTTPIISTPNNTVVINNTVPVSNDPNCQVASINGCGKCYYRFYYDSVSKKCVQVNAYCLTWNDLGYCLSCYPGYGLNGTVCQVTQSNSVSSSSGSSSSSTSQSTSSTQQTQQGAIIIYTDLNCQTLNINRNGCSKCYMGFYFNTVKNVCLAGNPSCKTWDNQGGCVTCYQGYQVSGNNCVISAVSQPNQPQTNNNINTGSIILINPSTPSSANPDINCKQFNQQTKTCTLCYYSYYFSSQANKCVSVNPVCKTWNNQGQCLTCYEGFVLNMYVCQMLPEYRQSNPVPVTDIPAVLDPLCSQYQNKKCIKCATRAYYDSLNQRCIEVDGNCRLWNENGVCISCYEGYTVYNQKQCRLSNASTSTPSTTYTPPTYVVVPEIRNPTNQDDLCRSTDPNGQCTQCVFRYVLNISSRKCIRVSDLCRTWNQSNALCTGCYSGYQLNAMGDCKLA